MTDREVFTYRDDHGQRLARVCFSCNRPIRDWETGYTATGLCESCQVEAEDQAMRDARADDDTGWPEEDRCLTCHMPQSACLCGETDAGVCEDCGTPVVAQRYCDACGEERDFKHGLGRHADPLD